MRKTVEVAAQRGVSHLTLFAFSSENWGRPADEVSKLMSLFIEALQREVEELHRNNVCLRFIGARERLQAELVRRIETAEERTRDNDGLNLIVATAYGGRWDIVEAAKSLATKAVNGEIDGLRALVEEAVSLLRRGGRLAVIAYHSLEDRAVKQAMRELARRCTCPPDMPVCGCGKENLIRVVTARPVRPTPDEIEDNPRARSARLRVAERL